jgi:hypothetical protein
LLQLDPSYTATTTTAALPSDSTPTESASHPILLPGIDILNHQPNHPVSWLTSPPPTSVSLSTSSSAGNITVQIHTSIPSDTQIYNNYGAKPSSELLLAYGFVLPSSPLYPFETHPLLLGGVPPTMTSLLSQVGLDPKERFELGPSGKVGGRLRGCLRVLVADEEEREILLQRLSEGKVEEEVWGVVIGGENELGSLDVLAGMLEGKIAGIQKGRDDAEGSVRRDVELMCRTYKEGCVTSRLSTSPKRKAKLSIL